MTSAASPASTPAATPVAPATWEADVVLNDGGTVHLRPIRPDDGDLLRAFHSRLSQQTVFNRYFAYRPALSDQDVHRFTHVDHDSRVAFVATLHGAVIGVVRYDRLPGTDDCEVAFVVEDAQQGRGLGPVLLEHLAAAARERGIARFMADVLPTNRAMLGVFRSAGFGVSRALGDGYVELSFPIQQTETSLQVMRDREHRAEARSVQRLLKPGSVAVVGASREPGAPGHEVLRSLLTHGFEGPVFPVNPAAAHVSGVRAYADVRDIPDPVDLAVVAVPAPDVAEVVRACSDKDVRGLVVVSGGFADGGPEGRARLEEVVRLAREGGMRLIGPNAMGVVNTDPAVRLHATFAAGSPPPGSVGVLSQSGALAGTFLQEAARRSLGLSAFVSIGDRADVSGNDLMQHWRADERTEVVVLHLRGFGNPRKFARIAREVGRTKPVVALKSGRGQGDVAVSALFASAGVVRVASLAQLFETAQLFAYQPLPAGRRVAVVGTSNALATLAADACREAGLEVPELSEPVRVRLRALTGTTETANPVDLGPVAGADELTAALEVLTTSGEVDAVLAVVVPPPHAGTGGSLVSALGGALRTAGSSGLPVLASFLGEDGVPDALAVRSDDGAPRRGSVPSYASPESAALALSRAVAYAEWRAKPQGTVTELRDVDLPAARAVLAPLPEDGSWLTQADAGALLSHVGIRVWPTVLVRSADEAVRVAAEQGWPVVLKAASEQWRHRLDVGAVRLHLADEGELRAAWESVTALTGESAAYVQPLAQPGVSTVVRLVQDPTAGPLLSLRLGGVAVDLLVDPVTRTLPLTDADAAELVRAIRGAELLTGAAGGAPAGAPPADVEALEELLLRVARVGEDLPSVAELVLDPVLVQRAGAVPLHAGVRLLPPGTDPERGARRLSGSYAVL